MIYVILDRDQEIRELKAIANSYHSSLDKQKQFTEILRLDNNNLKDQLRRRNKPINIIEFETI